MVLFVFYQASLQIVLCCYAYFKRNDILAISLYDTVVFVMRRDTK